MSEGFTNSACRGLSWTYDPWGNRTAQNVTAGTCGTSAVTVNNKNQFIGPPFQYDAAGNLTYDGSHSYTYDAENRLIKVDGGSTASYVYDADGQRARKTVGATATDFYYDVQGKPIVEIQSGVWSAGYAYLNGQLLVQYSNGTTYFVHGDHLGSTRLVTGVNQAIVQNLDYLPFGENNSADSHTSTHEFTGDERDAETSLDHTQFRQYTAQLARWISPDPAGLAAVDPTNPQSWNRYAYVLNDPIDLFDPLGLFTIGPQPGGSPDPTNPTFPPGCILVVDDDPLGNGDPTLDCSPQHSKNNPRNGHGGNSSGSAQQPAPPISPAAQACVNQANQQIQNQLQTFSGYAGTKLLGRAIIGAGSGAVVGLIKASKTDSPLLIASGAVVGAAIGVGSNILSDIYTIRKIQNSFMNKFVACMQNASVPKPPE